MIKHITPLKTHHSAGDWNFSSPNWRITNLLYQSPPSAFQTWNEMNPCSCLILCKNAAVLKLPWGRIVTWLRHPQQAAAWQITFRNTAPPGSANLNNCYQVYFSLELLSWYLTERQAGAVVREWSTAKSALLPNTWYHIRVNFIPQWDQMVVSLEIEIDATWVQQGELITVVNPLFEGEDYQRPGIQGNNPQYYNHATWDDTEIWEYVP